MAQNNENGAFSEKTDYEVPKSKDAPVPGWLKFSYLILPIWGLIAWYVYFNGSVGWLDRGYWQDLQVAANTTFPIQSDLREESKEGKKLINPENLPVPKQ